ncbi:hypothetical protein ABZV14_45460 [Streptosporangium canum]
MGVDLPYCRELDPVLGGGRVHAIPARRLPLLHLRGHQLSLMPLIQRHQHRVGLLARPHPVSDGVDPAPVAEDQQPQVSLGLGFVDARPDPGVPARALGALTGAVAVPVPIGDASGHAAVDPLQVHPPVARDGQHIADPAVLRQGAQAWVLAVDLITADPPRRQPGIQRISDHLGRKGSQPGTRSFEMEHPADLARRPSQEIIDTMNELPAACDSPLHPQ